MKKSVFSLISLVVAITSYSQNYHPFLQNIGWCQEEYFSLGSISTAYKNNGDTTIGNSSYQRLLKGNISFLVREDTVMQKVWVILPDSLSETLLYDFSISSGSQITLNYVGYDPVLYTVESTEMISTPLGLRKQIRLITNDTIFNPDLYWIEGIGSSYGPVYLNDPDYAPQPMQGSCLICAYITTGVQSYSGSCGLDCYPYPGSSCNSFITGIQMTNGKPEIIVEKISPDLIRIQSKKNKINQVQVFSIEGKRLKTIPVFLDDDVMLSTGDWAIGIYVIEISSDSGTKTPVKFCK
jgi:hypothetical protein